MRHLPHLMCSIPPPPVPFFSFIDCIPRYHRRPAALQTNSSSEYTHLQTRPALLPNPRPEPCTPDPGAATTRCSRFAPAGHFTIRGASSFPFRLIENIANWRVFVRSSVFRNARRLPIDLARRALLGLPNSVLSAAWSRLCFARSSRLREILDGISQGDCWC